MRIWEAIHFFSNVTRTKSLDTRLDTLLTSCSLACLMSLWVKMGQIGLVRGKKIIFLSRAEQMYSDEQICQGHHVALSVVSAKLTLLI